MKGVKFIQPLEFNLEIKGENWRQGETIKGVLTLANHGNDTCLVENLKVLLVHGEFKKVKTKDISGWNELKSHELVKSENLTQGNSCKKEWEFVLEDDCNVTDNSGSLFILYGMGDNLEDYGNLQLHIDIKEELSQFLTIFENFFRFKAAQKKSKKEYVDIKFNPPAGSKKMSAVDALNCKMRIKDQVMEINYSFKLTKLDLQDGVAKATKIKKEFKQTLSQKEYALFGGAPNQDKIIEKINEVITEVIPKII